jgi:hypothetical protein
MEYNGVAFEIFEYALLEGQNQIENLSRSNDFLQITQGDIQKVISHRQ